MWIYTGRDPSSARRRRGVGEGWGWFHAGRVGKQAHISGWCRAAIRLMNPPEDVATPGEASREAPGGIHFHGIGGVFAMLEHRKTRRPQLSAPSPVRLSIIKQEVQIGLIPARRVVDALLCERAQ